MPNSQDFCDRLRSELEKAGKRGEPLVMKAGELHRLVGGYPGPNHRMPACCLAMRKEMCHGDEIQYEPPSGQGATLEVRYAVRR